MRRCVRLYGLMPQLKLGSSKTEFFTSLWNKPATRDEQVKDYIPEVLEESLAEQRAVIQEDTSRDVIVELGHKVLLQIENKSPTPSIAPLLNKLLVEYGVHDLIAQRPLSYLLYPNSSASGTELPHELISSFTDNFRRLVEEVEQSGCSVKRNEHPLQEEKDDSREVPTSDALQGEVASPPHDATASASAEATESDSVPVLAHEPMDITLFVRVTSGMALANAKCGDARNAIRCVDAAIGQVIDSNRLGGLLGLKAGLLVRQGKYAEAAEAAELAVEASGNLQGYLHGAYALRMLQKPQEVIQFLERGRGDHPMNQEIATQLEHLKKDEKVALPIS